MSQRAPGYVKVYRSMTDPQDRYWIERREFSRWEARFDLLMQARFAPTTYTTRHGSDQLGRGELVASLNYLSERWGWHRNKVARFLKKCTADGFLARQRAGQTADVYLIVNYERYQGSDSDTGTPTATATGQERDKREEGKKGKTAVRGDGRRTWLSPYLDALVAQHPESVFEEGEMARYIARVEKILGPEETVARWCRYLVRTPLEYVTGKNFAKVHTKYAGNALTAGDAQRPSVSRDEILRKQGYSVGA